MTHERWLEIKELAKKRKTSLKAQDDLIETIERLMWSYPCCALERIEKATEEIRATLPFAPNRTR